MEIPVKLEIWELQDSAENQIGCGSSWCPSNLSTVQLSIVMFQPIFMGLTANQQLIKTKII